MIIKGKSRAGPIALAAHLANAETNERVELVETRGTVAQDLRGALIEMDAYAAGTRCQKSLYHAALSPEPPHVLTSAQRSEAIDALEQKLGLNGHARLVVVHEKHERQHIHVVWSRIDLEKMRSVADSHNYRKHEEVARDLERRFGHDRVQGAHHERDGVERPNRTPSRPELRQEERTGITGNQVRAEVTRAFRSSDNAEAFKAALEDRGYILAQGDRRDFVVLDREGGVHSLARRIDGIKAADLREFMQPIDREALPSVDQAKEMVAGVTRQPALDRDEESRRAEARGSDRIEAAYSRGDDYVHQSSAAQRDFERRQERLGDENDFRPQRPGESTSEEEDEVRRREQEKTARNQDEVNAQSGIKSLSQEPGNAEVTDRMARLLGGAAEGRERDRGEEDLGDRQREAPGGGRSRGRFE
jgi:hypothetical protein